MNRRKFIVGLTAFAITKNAFSQTNTITISAAGDVTLGGCFNADFERIQNNEGLENALEYPFKNVLSFFRNSDISIVNLEGVLTTNNKKRNKGAGAFHFKGNPVYSQCLKKGGVNIVNIANNHFMDYNINGALDTISSLENSSIKYCGTSKKTIIEKNGILVSFLGYKNFGYPLYFDLTSNPKKTSDFKRDIQEAKNSSDIVIVSCHFGKEHSYIPSKFQREFARTAIDCGADIFLGHHPHVLQGIEEIQTYTNKRLIFYSLGNFAFGGNTYPKDLYSMIAKIVCSKEGVVNYSITPIITHSSPSRIQPFVPNFELRNAINNKVKNLSELIKD